MVVQTSHALATGLNVIQTSHSYGDLMLLMKAIESKQVCIFLLNIYAHVNLSCI